MSDFFDIIVYPMLLLVVSFLAISALVWFFCYLINVQFSLFLAFMFWVGAFIAAAVLALIFS